MRKTIILSNKTAHRNKLRIVFYNYGRVYFEIVDNDGNCKEYEADYDNTDDLIEFLQKSKDELCPKQ